MFLYYLLIRPIEIVLEFVYRMALTATFNYGFSIIILSLVINILILPLYQRADSLQTEAANKEKKISKWISHIRKSFKGDERFMIQSAYYRIEGYSVLTQLNGVLPLVIEIPFFIAAYHFLSGYIDLPGNAFGVIADLGQPDQLIHIGSVNINLLPILMTMINIFSSLVYAQDMTAKKKIQLLSMAVIFLILLYTSPSGLVLYWTMNNLFSLLKNIYYKLEKHTRIRRLMIMGCVMAVLLAAAYIRSFGTKRIVYMCCAFLGTIFIFGFYYLLRNKRKKRKPDQEKISGKNGSDYWLGVICLAVMSGLFIPAVMIADSTSEFITLSQPVNPINYVFSNFMIAVGFFVIWISVYYLLLKDKVNNLIITGEAAIVAVALIDYMFFGREYGTITPELRYNSIPAFTNRNIVVNLIVIAITLMIAFIIFRKQIIRKAFYISCICAIVIMSGINIVKINNEYNQFIKIYDVGNGVNENALHLSKNGKNVIVFMLDGAMGLYLPYLTEEKPELKSQFSGFIYYPNCISHGVRTILGSPGLFGGYEYTPQAMNERSDEALMDKHNEALKMLPCLFSENGYQVTVLDPPLANYQNISDLSIFNDLEGVNAYSGKMIFPEAEDTKRNNFIKNNNIFRYSIFRFSPVVLQKYLYDDGHYFDQISGHAAGSSSTYILDHLEEAIDVRDDENNYLLVMDNEITHDGVILNKPDYSYGSDNGSKYHENNEAVDAEGNVLRIETDDMEGMYDVNMYTMLRIGQILDYMKEEGVYDNTRIILVSDHGALTGQFDNIKAEKAACLLMYKDFYSDGDIRKDDTFMTNADTPTLAVNGLISEPINPYTGKVIDSSKKAEPQLVCNYLTWHTQTKADTVIDDGGEWYKVQDDIFDESNWEELE